MSIRPIDLQILVPKTAEYSQQHQGEINRQNMDQMTFAQISTKEAELQQSKVIETNEDKFINKDGQNKQEQQKSKKKKKAAEKEEEKEKRQGTGLFDVRI